jgi:hypothetical protein
MARDGWTGELYEIVFDMKAIKRDLFHRMIFINEEAGQTWVEEAVYGTPIPIWSGASRASFARLAAKLGWYVPSGPRVKTCPFSRGHDFGMKYDGGTEVYKNRKEWYVGFQYATKLPHLIYNESNSPNPGPYPQPWSTRVRYTPYNFEGRALKAWKKVAKKAKLPHPFKNLKFRKLK